MFMGEAYTALATLATSAGVGPPRCSTAVMSVRLQHGCLLFASRPDALSACVALARMWKEQRRPCLCKHFC